MMPALGPALPPPDAAPPADRSPAPGESGAFGLVLDAALAGSPTSDDPTPSGTEVTTAPVDGALVDVARGELAAGEVIEGDASLVEGSTPEPPATPDAAVLAPSLPVVAPPSEVAPVVIGPGTPVPADTVSGDPLAVPVDTPPALETPAGWVGADAEDGGVPVGAGSRKPSAGEGGGSVLSRPGHATTSPVQTPPDQMVGAADARDSDSRPETARPPSAPSPTLTSGAVAPGGAAPSGAARSSALPASTPSASPAAVAAPDVAASTAALSDLPSAAPPPSAPSLAAPVAVAPDTAVPTGPGAPTTPDLPVASTTGGVVLPDTANASPVMSPGVPADGEALAEAEATPGDDVETARDASDPDAAPLRSSRGDSGGASGRERRGGDAPLDRRPPDAAAASFAPGVSADAGANAEPGGADSVAVPEPALVPEPQPSTADVRPGGAEAVRDISRPSTPAPPARLATSAWLSKLDAGRTSQSVQVALGGGDGMVHLQTQREGEGRSVTVRFSDPELQALASAHVGRLREALDAHFAEPVRLSLGDDPQGADASGADTPGSDARGGADEGGARGGARSSSGARLPSAPPDARALASGGRREWIG